MKKWLTYVCLGVILVACVYSAVIMGGMEPALAAMILVPEPWENNETLSVEERDFYQYQSKLITFSCSPASMAAFISLPPLCTLQRLMSSPSTASIFNFPICDLASRPATILMI